MLREIQHVVPGPDGERRRWFTSDFFDLFVFYEGQRIASFQLCYDKTGAEHALTWNGRGFAHLSVDSGEATPFRNLTPILTRSGKGFGNEVIRRFRDECRSIDPNVTRMILENLAKLEETN